MSFGAKLVSLPVMFLITIYEDNYKYIIMNGNLQSTLKYYFIIIRLDLLGWHKKENEKCLVSMKMQFRFSFITQCWCMIWYSNVCGCLPVCKYKLPMRHAMTYGIMNHVVGMLGNHKLSVSVASLIVRE